MISELRLKEIRGTKSRCISETKDYETWFIIDYFFHFF